MKKLRTNNAGSIEPATPRFWRDAALPVVETRAIDDGRTLSYGRHSHDSFSIGIVLGGQSSYVNGSTRERVGAGTVVAMNPGDAHVCNPLGDQAWAYRMLYVDTRWLAGMQREMGCGSDEYQPFATTWTRDAGLYERVARLYVVLTDIHAPILEKEGALVEFAMTLHRRLQPARNLSRYGHPDLARAAQFIRDNYTRSLKLDEICAASGLSASYLIRAFRSEYGMTPHAYLLNCRIEFCRSQLRLGRSIAEVAADAGFADQAHLQRSFKKVVAATPGQYRA